MDLYCTDEFKATFDKLSKEKAYATLEAELISQYCNTTYDAACTGDPLSVFPNASYLKKRLEGKGGYRVYVLGVVKKDAIYLTYVHPKTGPYKLASIDMAKKKQLLKDVLAAIKGGKLLKVSEDPINSGKLLFK